jgi:hypothetical protein
MLLQFSKNKIMEHKLYTFWRTGIRTEEAKINNKRKNIVNGKLNLTPIQLTTLTVAQIIRV